VRSDKRFHHGIDEITGYETRSMIVVPVSSKERMLGVFQAINKLEGFFTQNDLDM